MRVGCICDNGPSHIMSSAAIGRALTKRGHDFTLFGLEHLKPWIEKEGINSSYLPHSPELAGHHASTSAGRSFSTKEIIGALDQNARFLLRELPAVIQKAGVDCMLVDANLPAASCVVESQSLPSVTFCSALPPHEEPTIPPGFLPWAYNSAAWARLRNQSAYLIRDQVIRPLLRTLNSFRSQNGLKPYAKLFDSLSQFAQITQLVAEFDFPRNRLPPCFHYVGPYFRRTESGVSFPFERLDGRPLVYAALGTTLDVDPGIWTSIAEACAPLGLQVVLATSRTLKDLPGNPVVVSYAPQEALLARAALFITHAGLNSALESLAHGVPMLAMPFVADQMGVASRIVFRGVGLSLRQDRSAGNLAIAVSKLLNNSSYRDRSLAIAKVIESSPGAEGAAKIIERVAMTKQPVLRGKL